MKTILDFLMTLLSGNTAPIGYVIAILFSVTGGILLANPLPNTKFLIAAIVLLVVGLGLFAFLVSRDVKEVMTDIKKCRKQP